MRLHLIAVAVIAYVGAACDGHASGRTDTLPHSVAHTVPHTDTASTLAGAAQDTSTTAAAQAGSPDTATRQPAVFDSVLATVHARQTTCYRLARYFVVERDDGETGADVLVRRREATAGPDPACALDSLPGDFVSRNDSTGAFAGIHGRWLFLLDSDAPEGGYVVHDVATGRIATELDGDDLVRWRDSVTLELWVRRDTVPHARCPEVPAAMVAGIDSLVAVDVRSGARVASGVARCAARS